MINSNAKARPSLPLIGSYKYDYLWTSKVLFKVPGTYTFIIPDNVYKIRALVWGAGGSGAFHTSNDYIALGGDGGGYTERVWACVPRSIITVIIGIGGAAPTGIGNGANGGTSSLVDSTNSVTLSATGGAGGIYADSAVAGTYNGSSPGTGSGGTINATGGRRGIGIFTSSSRVTYGATGGGAAGSWLGTGGHGGDITNSSGSAKTTMVTGGGAIGGKNGGSISDPSYGLTGGAGVLDSAVDIVSAPYIEGGTTYFYCAAQGGRGKDRQGLVSSMMTNSIGLSVVAGTDSDIIRDWFEIYDISGFGGHSGLNHAYAPEECWRGKHGGNGAGGGASLLQAGNGGILAGGGGQCFGNILSALSILKAGDGGQAGGGGGGKQGKSGQGGDGMVLLYM